MVRYSFIVRLLHPLLQAGFDRRFLRPRFDAPAEFLLNEWMRN
jgi:hypothetical protein